MKVLLINPWGIKNDEYYTSGFVFGMNRYVDLSVVSNYYYNGQKPNGKLYNYFFKVSEHMKRSRYRSLIRGIEYVYTWNKIINLAKTTHYDVIHFHWLLMYDIDLVYLKRIKKYCDKLILTAHNILPHIDGEKSLSKLQKIYDIFDIILVHGEAIKKEFMTYFPEYIDKVQIQFHGEYFGQSKESCNNTDQRIQDIYSRIHKFEKTYIVFGLQFYNKGTDRITNLWLKDSAFDNCLLIVAGSVDSGYSELLNQIDELKGKNNVVLLDYFVEDNVLNYCIENSDIVVIPYRHASMSGVLHTAAVFSKPVLCTRTGALAEYLKDNYDSFICENDDIDIEECMKKTLMISNKQLNQMGVNLTSCINENYSWNSITDKLYKEVYCL